MKRVNLLGPGPSLMKKGKSVGTGPSSYEKSKSVGTGPSSYGKRIYGAAVSQRLRNTALDTIIPNSMWQVLELLKKNTHLFFFIYNREWDHLCKSEASIETTLRSALPEVWISAEQESFCPPKVPHRLWGPPCLLLNDSFPGEKRRGYEFYHPPQISAEVKNE